MFSVALSQHFPASDGRQRRRWPRVLVLLTMVLLANPATPATEPAGRMKGLPLTRFYSFDDIGDVSRGAQLSFDAVGRLAIVHDGVYLVLNDDVWLDRAPRKTGEIKAQRVMRDIDGTCYYGSLGSWGLLIPTEQGQLRTEPLTPADCPEWVLLTNFTTILGRPEGIYFFGQNGVAFRDRHTQQTTFVKIPGVAYAFTLSDRVYVSSHVHGMLHLDLNRGTYHEADRAVFDTKVVDQVAVLDDQRAIMSTTGRRLYLYEHNRLTALSGPLAERAGGRITALQTLSDGNVAVAINGQGLYLITPGGEIVSMLTHPDYQYISSLATNDRGVLWAATESGVAKILYGAPVTSFGQAHGLPIGWPQIRLWDGRTIMASNGRVYEPAVVTEGDPVRFQLMENQPANGSWGIATWQEWLLLANARGVFVRQPGQPFQHIVPDLDVGRLAMLGPDTCLAIGEKEIAALRYEAGAWRECAPRVPGLGYPSVVHSSHRSVWIEFGANRAGRVTLASGRLRTQVFESFPWREPRWIHVSLVGDTAVLSGPENGRIYVDEATGELCKTPPPLATVLEHAPYWPARVQQDTAGRIWATHAHGIYTLDPGANGYEADSSTYRIISEHLPLVQILSNGEIWMSTGRSLYHAQRTRSSGLPARFKPLLVSARDLRTNRELLDPEKPAATPLRLSYGQNSIALRFFAGSYAWRHTPGYEFRLNDADWTSLDATSLLRLSDLREGSYKLVVRLIDTRGPVGEEMAFTFAIAPPWYRTWYAYGAYALAAIGFVFGLIRLFLFQARARTVALERTVAQRTEELKATMKKLQQETRTAATLAERNRLAGEIHDSLEQGFSGLLLQLETTAGLAQCPAEIQQGLSVARSMVAFSRNEVRHAVWDLHSPMLDEGDLKAALKHLIAQSVPDPSRACVTIRGQPRPIGSTTEHHLLRIAQEAIANAVKHAQAERLDVELAFAETEVRLSIHDNGRGFDPQKVISGGQSHFGLRSLRGRAAKIGGTLEITSTPGSGTRITVRVPLHASGTA